MGTVFRCSQTLARRLGLQLIEPILFDDKMKKMGSVIERKAALYRSYKISVNGKGAPSGRRLFSIFYLSVLSLFEELP